jgi:thiosulfate/3-mercaptopyruvate sulfurtransferase
VVYDDNRNLHAGRAWWVLRWAGVAGTRLLDGGLDAWIAAGLSTTTDIVLPAPGDITLDGGHLPVLDADAAAALADTAILIDARNTDAYLGGPVRPGEAPSGHIPGALSAPTTENLAANGTLAAAEALRKRFAALGIDGTGPVGVYCGGGVAASHEIAALASIGITAALFPGSWSAWSSDPSRPVATGPRPS